MTATDNSRHDDFFSAFLTDYIKPPCATYYILLCKQTFSSPFKVKNYFRLPLFLLRFCSLKPPISRVTLPVNLPNLVHLFKNIQTSLMLTTE